MYVRSEFAKRITPINTTDGPTRTAADTAVCSPADCATVIEANQIQVGTRLRFRVSGTLASVITTPGVARFLVKMGIITVFDTLAILLDTVAAHAALPFVLIIELECRVAGAGTTAKFMPVGCTFTSEAILGVPASQPTAGATVALPWAAAPALGTGFDSTIANILTLHSTQTVDTGEVIVQGYCVEQIG